MVVALETGKVAGSQTSTPKETRYSYANARWQAYGDWYNSEEAQVNAAWHSHYHGLPESEDIIRQAEYLDEGQLNYLRKKILDSGNDVRRELFACMENFEIKFKK